MPFHTELVIIGIEIVTLRRGEKGTFYFFDRHRRGRKRDAALFFTYGGLSC
jgi:hypothetical protein